MSAGRKGRRGRLSGAPTVGASDEVLMHHMDEHGRHCGSDADYIRYDCPCEATLMLACGGCGQPVFVAIKPRTWCEHAQWLREKGML